MNIIVDIGHPAHVHYFKNFIRIMKEKGHNILVFSRDKECTIELLNRYDIPFIPRGKGKNGPITKLTYMLKADLYMYRKAKKFKPDIFLSFSTVYPSQVAWFMRKPHICCDDTEHAKFSRYLYRPFTKKIFTPYGYFKDVGKKQIPFKSFMELCYLHPNYFKPDKSVYALLNLNEGEKYIILRFVSWNAHHDYGQIGLTLETKKEIIDYCKDKCKIFISSEADIPEEFKKYQIQIPVEKMHDVLANAEMFIGEGATMASECAMLGTPAIYVNSLDAGTLQQQTKFGLIYSFRNSEGVVDKFKELINNENLKNETLRNRDKMLEEMIDPTQMLVDYFENYSETKTL
jgi:uncharacterized protein